MVDGGEEWLGVYQPFRVILKNSLERIVSTGYGTVSSEFRCSSFIILTISTTIVSALIFSIIKI